MRRRRLTLQKLTVIYTPRFRCTQPSSITIVIKPPIFHWFDRSISKLTYGIAVAVLGISIVYGADVPANGPAERRVALVIGNGRYHERALRNPSNDAEALSHALTK